MFIYVEVAVADGKPTFRRNCVLAYLLIHIFLILTFNDQFVGPLLYEAALDCLSLVTHMKKNICVRAFGGTKSASRLDQFSPNLVLLIREKCL